MSAEDKLLSEKAPVLDAGGASPLVSLKELVALSDSQAAHRALLEFQAVGKLAVLFSTLTLAAHSALTVSKLPLVQHRLRLRGDLRQRQAR